MPTEPSTTSTTTTTHAAPAAVPATVTHTTTPATPVPTVARDIVWIRAHAIICLIAVCIIAGGIVGGVNLFERLIEKHDARMAAEQQQREGVDIATQSALVAQLNQYRATDATRDAAQTALIASLTTKMQQTQAATTKQVTVDATLDAQAAAARLVSQTKASPSDVMVTNNTVAMSLPLTRTVVSDLDTLSQSQSDVVNLQGQVAAQQTLTTDAKTELGTANQIIASDKTELIATVKADNAACDVRVDAQSAKDRKRGFWATLAGFAGGIILGSRF